MTARHLICGLAAKKVKASLSEGGGALDAAATAAAAASASSAAAAVVVETAATSMTPVFLSRSPLSLPSFSTLLLSFLIAALDPSTGHLPTM